MQVRVSVECGHATPPAEGSALVRLRFCDPAPHDLVQLDHAVQVAMLQSAAHACVLQARVSAECGHAAPPLLGSVKVRLRDCEPLVPHELVHVDQALKLNTKQSVGHP